MTTWQTATVAAARLEASPRVLELGTRRCHSRCRCAVHQRRASCEALQGCLPQGSTVAASPTALATVTAVTWVSAAYRWGVFPPRVPGLTESHPERRRHHHLAVTEGPPPRLARHRGQGHCHRGCCRWPGVRLDSQRELPPASTSALDRWGAGPAGTRFAASNRESRGRCRASNGLRRSRCPEWETRCDGRDPRCPQAIQ